MKRRIKRTDKVVDVELVSEAVYTDKDDNTFYESELDYYIGDKMDKEGIIPYWVLSNFYDYLKKLPLNIQLELLPWNGETPCGLGTYIKGDNSNILIDIRDWYHDRSSISIIEHKTSKYTSIENAVYYSLRDIFSFVNTRYPKDEYLIKIINKVKEFVGLPNESFFDNYLNA